MLKPNRSYEVFDDVSFFCDTVSERGKLVVFDTSVGGSGASLDNPQAQVSVLAGSTPSGTIPAGVLMQDVVNKDLTQTHLNFHKDEVQINGKVTVRTKGWVVTNNVSGSPTVGAPAYYNSVSEFTPTAAGGVPQVGKFLSKLDSDGYAKISIDL